ncbi:putative Dual specificity protein phosphatase 10 [Hypsibius exemplaris]|uniref:protein-tyrosine-phosphatase n=1 Tax=Hypsibius exemplaris TaxID=2072580 RepID=A0A1W0WAG5_HYPEX|nr:putative Dual specificity protein phosphatase 10 [Hypsibius exemplaris]
MAVKTARAGFKSKFLANPDLFPYLLINGGFADFNAQFPDLCDGHASMKSQPASLQQGPRLRSPASSPTTEVDLERVEASQVLPYLYLGNERDAGDIKRLSDLKVKYILNVTSHSPLHFEKEGLRYKRIPASDSGQQNLMQYFQEAFDFIDEARRSDSNVLIHCQAGVSRSATIVIAYVMHSMQLSMDEAYKLVKDKRSVISPNLNFMGQLDEYGKGLMAAAAQDQVLPQTVGRQRVLSMETSL